MLVLTRKLGETINVGDSIRIQILGVRGKQVRIGIEAPASFQIHRSELLEKIRIANMNAAKEHISTDIEPVSRLLNAKGPADEN